MANFIKVGDGLTPPLNAGIALKGNVIDNGKESS